MTAGGELRDQAAARSRALVGAALLSVSLLAGAEAAVAGDGAEFSTDCSHTYVNKAVGKEQWAITWDLVSRVSGNVFKRDGSAPSFVECFRRAARDPGQLSFECFGAVSCAKPPCSQKWQSLGPVSVPETFFYPRGVDPRKPKAACAPDLRVCRDGCPFSKIGDAIEAAPPGSFIHVADGVYKEVVKPEDKPFTLYGEPGAVLEGSPSGAQIPNSSDVIMQMRCDESSGGLRRIVGMTIRGEGPKPWTWYYPYKGGITNSGCDLSIEDSTVEGNHAGAAPGGGILNGGRLLIARTTFARNGGSSGGAIANHSLLEVFDGKFVGNNTPDGPDYNGGGGAIYSDASGDVVIANSRFDGNRTSRGCCAGGAILSRGGLEIDGSVIENSVGAAIVNWDAGRLTVRGCRLEGNSEDGALRNEGFALVEDSVLAGNSGPSFGGVTNLGGEIVLRKSRLSRNSADGAGALAGGILNRGGRIELEGVVFEENACLAISQAQPCAGALWNESGVIVAGDVEFRGNDQPVCENVDFSCE